MWTETLKESQFGLDLNTFKIYYIAIKVEYIETQLVHINLIVPTTNALFCCNTPPLQRGIRYRYMYFFSLY